MRCIRVALLVSLIGLLIPAISHSSMVMMGKKTNLQSLSFRAKLILHVQLLAVDRVSEGKSVPGLKSVGGRPVGAKAINRYEFLILDKGVIKNETSKNLQPGDIFIDREFMGLNMKDGKVGPISLRRPEFQEGNNYIIFWAGSEDNPYILGVDIGVFHEAKGMVTNKYMKSTVFKGMSLGSPKAAKAMKAGGIRPDEPGPAVMDLDKFTEMVKILQ